ncbi:hypothetical protein Ahy_B08g092498 [Arachis hypogaea]|uniref:Uncharacterized protein n=1 Tax=Arachis hypogaea TaxID=3818 RepID=A0A444Y405_ARAHY|nr:hypothetical protein Ahy_B08g092498 [Arachis hypogaea]
MASEENFLVLMHYRGSIKKKIRSGINFTDKNSLSIFLKPTTSFANFVNSTIQKLGIQQVEKLFYRIPISVLKWRFSPSFAVDLNRSGDGEVAIIDRVPVSLQRGAPHGIDDALLDDDDVDDVEPDIIADDSGDDIAASNPVGAGRASSSGTQQYPLPPLHTFHLWTWMP